MTLVSKTFWLLLAWVKIILFFLVSATLLFSCYNPAGKPDEVRDQDYFSNDSSKDVWCEAHPEYAKGFRIKYTDSCKVVELLYPWDGDRVSQKIFLVKKNALPPKNEYPGIIIKIPVKSMVCMSATHVSFADKLNIIENISGVSDANFVISEKFRELINDGHIKEVGMADQVKIENLIDLQPDFVMVSPQKGQSFKPIENAGIIVVPNGDYLENTPLGRAEWIKFMAVFFDREELANKVFDSVKTEYLQLKALTKDIKERPKVLSGKQFSGIWYLPGGNSYVSNILSDAGAEYIFSDNAETGSLPLDFETVYDKGFDTDYWRFLIYSPGKYSFNDLLLEDSRYEDLIPFRNRKIIYCNTYTKPYYQTGLLEPHLILADYIHIFHPELLPEYKPVYFELMK